MRTARFIFTLALAFGIVFVPLSVGAQQPSRAARIGYLEFGASPLGTPFGEAFRQGLRELGYIEGQNITIEYRWAEGRFDRLPDLANELVRLKVDVIFASTTPAALAAKQATATIPIVIGFVADPVRSGLVASLGRPGGNITGWSHVAGLELGGKRLELLKEAFPGATRVAVLFNPANPIHGPGLKEVEIVARALKVELDTVGVQDANELEHAFSTMARKRTEALFVFVDGMFLAEQRRIIDLAAKSRLPAMYGIRELAEAGGLMAYGVNLRDLYRRTAYFLAKILKGAKPGDLPVEQPTKFELVINLKTAKALGLTIPQSVLMRADEVIQ